VLLTELPCFLPGIVGLLNDQAESHLTCLAKSKRLLATEMPHAL
jgi:hypothetical protein